MLCYKATDADVGEKLLIIASTCTSWLVLAEFTMHRSRAVLVRHSTLFTSSFPHSWGKSKASRVVFRRRQRRKRGEIVEIHYFILLWTAKERFSLIFVELSRVSLSHKLADSLEHFPSPFFRLFISLCFPRLTVSFSPNYFFSTVVTWNSLLLWCQCDYEAVGEIKTRERSGGQHPTRGGDMKNPKISANNFKVVVG